MLPEIYLAVAVLTPPDRGALWSPVVLTTSLCLCLSLSYARFRVWGFCSTVGLLGCWLDWPDKLPFPLLSLLSTVRRLEIPPGRATAWGLLVVKRLQVLWCSWLLCILIQRCLVLLKHCYPTLFVQTGQMGTQDASLGKTLESKENKVGSDQVLM